MHINKFVYTIIFNYMLKSKNIYIHVQAHRFLEKDKLSYFCLRVTLFLITLVLAMFCVLIHTF